VADLAKLLLPRVFPGSVQAKTSPADPTGLGDAGVSLDPVADAVGQLSALNAYFAVVMAGGNPTASQLAAAQSALGAIGADLRAIQAKPQPPAGTGVWVSGPAAVGVAAGSALVGGVVGWFARGNKAGSK